MTSNSLFQIHENLAIDVYFMGVFIKCIFLIVVLVSDTRRKPISFKKLQALDSYIKKANLLVTHLVVARCVKAFVPQAEG